MGTVVCTDLHTMVHISGAPCDCCFLSDPFTTGRLYTICGVFIVPYLLWFVYLAAGACFLFFKDKKGFLQAARFAISGMTIFLIICTIFPNGLALRPTIFVHDNVFVDLVKIVYSTDTPTNVLPSMHVFLSVGMCMALNRTRALKDKHGIRLPPESSHLSLCFLPCF